MRNLILQQKIYDIIANIPLGSVATYGQIAWMAGIPRAPRVVGYVVSNAPSGLALPFHRVVNSLGRMAPDHVFGGERIQRAMLEKEGVVFLKNGSIDMEKCRWKVM